MGVREAKGKSSKTTVRGGGFKFDIMDVMGYVDLGLIEGASSLFKFSTRAGAKCGSNDSGNACRAGVSPSAQDFMNENTLGKVVTRIGKFY